MRVPLKGLNRVRKRLADGSIKDYYYLGKGGPPVHGDYGSPEFHVSYVEAAQSRRPVRKNDLQSLIERYLDSPDYEKLADATKELYGYCIRAIEAEFATLPLSALDDREIRGEFLQWRARLGKRSPRQADLAFRTLARIIAWGCHWGIISTNPCQRAGKLYSSDRRDKVWTEEHEDAFLQTAPKHLRLAFMLALLTGQRQGDLLRLTWANYDGSVIRLKQQKTKALVAIPVTQALKIALDEAKAEAARTVDDEAQVQERTILTNSAGNAWSSDGFKSSWRTACQKAGITGLTFHDLRGTAVTRLANAGCTIPEIATITGHSLAHVHGVLEFYLNRGSVLAESAIRKLEEWTKGPTKRPTGE